MPIVVKDFDWTQTVDSVCITLPLKGVHASKADVYSNDVYIKVNFPPYFFQLDLLHPVDSETSTCTVGNGTVVFQLVKVDKGVTWTGPTYIPTSNSEDIQTRRDEAEKRALKRVEDAKEKRRKDKANEERRLIQKQIDVERAARERIEGLKLAEKEAAQASLATWTQGTKQSVVAGDAQKRSDSGIFNDNDALLELEDDDIDMEAIRAKVRGQLKVKEPPPPRQPTSISINYTSRGLLPTQTARESEDAKWQIKIKHMQDMHAKKNSKNALESGDAKDDEKNPELLKDKAIQFFKSGNWEAALNAFTAAIDLNSNFHTYYSNRAACYLKLDRPSDALSDCMSALEILEKEQDILMEQLVSESLEEQVKRHKSKLKVLLRKGAAQQSMGNLKGALTDFQAALAMDPQNTEILTSLVGLQSIIDKSVQV